MNVTLRLPSLVLLALSASALGACGIGEKEAPSAKTEMAGKIVFTQGSFEDAKKYKTFDEFKAAHKVIEELVVAAPQTSLRYYAVFQEPLKAEQYVVQVFDRTELGTTVRTEEREGTPTTGQTTAGWTFDIPQWPVPEDAEKVVVNNVWIKPGHRYEVVILKPLAKGEFSVAAAPTPAPTPAPKAPAKKKK